MECQDSIIVSLQNTSQLIHHLPFSALTILLFTATWSIESQYVREVVRNASCRAKCGASVRVYELSWPTQPPISTWDKIFFDPVFSERWPSSVIRNGLRKGSTHRINVEGHKNITSAVRWLPCVQLFTNRTGYVRPWTYRNSFEEEALMSELEHFCKQNGPPALSTAKRMQASKSEHFLARNKNKRFADRLQLLSKDEFSKALNAAATSKSNASGKTVGMMVVLRGGLRSLLGGHNSAWQAISSSVNASLWENKFQWVLTVVDSLSHFNLVQRVGVSDIVSSNGIALVLVDGAVDENEVVNLTADMTSVRCVTELLESFVYRRSLTSMICRSKRNHQGDRVGIEKIVERKVRRLHALHKPAAWREHFDVDQNRISLVDWLRGNYESEETTETIVWIVVYEKWCAFCQRHLGVYQKLNTMVQRAGAMVEVVMVEGCEGLNWWMDEMVDGFPTVLTIRSFSGHIEVSEYKGEHGIGAIVQEHDEENRRKLMRVSM